MSVGEITTVLSTCLEQADRRKAPYRHWRLTHVLPEDVCAAVRALPFPPPQIDDTGGKRETHNSTRVFFSAENRARFAVCRDVAAALQQPAMVARLEETFEIDLEGSYLRIEYCQDVEGFWLEPHTDIGAKLFTLQLYLSTSPGAEAWGTDILADPETLVETVPAVPNTALVFIPAHDTWHGYHRRPMPGVRKSLIINYVKPEWRSRHELAFPDQPVG